MHDDSFYSHSHSGMTPLHWPLSVQVASASPIIL